MGQVNAKIFPNTHSHSTLWACQLEFANWCNLRNLQLSLRLFKTTPRNGTYVTFEINRLRSVLYTRQSRSPCGLSCLFHPTDRPNTNDHTQLSMHSKQAPDMPHSTSRRASVFLSVCTFVVCAYMPYVCVSE